MEFEAHERVVMIFLGLRNQPFLKLFAVPENVRGIRNTKNHQHSLNPHYSIQKHTPTLHVQPLSLLIIVLDSTKDRGGKAKILNRLSHSYHKEKHNPKI